MGNIYVYHHNDHDGIVAAGVLYHFLLRNDYYSVVFNMIDYQTKLNFDHIDFNDDDEIFFLDYSFSNNENLEEFRKLLERRITGYEVTWIDHHKTSIGVLEEYGIPGIRTKGLCGAALTYIYTANSMYDPEITDEELSERFHNNEKIPLFLKYIDDYDCWKHIYTETNDFHYGLTVSDPKDEIISNLLNTYDECTSSNYTKQEIIRSIISTGKEIQNYLKFENKEYHIKMYGFEYTLPEEHGGYKCFCINRKGNSHMFGDKIEEYDAVIPFYFNGSRWTYSMYTEKDNVDCEAVAKSFGGGGHLKAAGWTSDKLLFE